MRSSLLRPGVQLGEELLEVVALPQGVEVGVLLHVGRVLPARGDGPAEQGHGPGGVRLGAAGVLLLGGADAVSIAVVVYSWTMSAEMRPNAQLTEAV